MSDLKTKAREVESHGRFGDTMLVHLNPAEVAGLASLSPTGKLTRNPYTGLPEAFLPMLAPLLGGWLGSSLLGSTLGMGLATGLGSGLGSLAATGDPKQAAISGLLGGGMAGIMNTGANALAQANPAGSVPAGASGAAAMVPRPGAGMVANATQGAPGYFDKLKAGIGATDWFGKNLVDTTLPLAGGVGMLMADPYMGSKSKPGGNNNKKDYPEQFPRDRGFTPAPAGYRHGYDPEWSFYRGFNRGGDVLGSLRERAGGGTSGGAGKTVSPPAPTPTPGPVATPPTPIPTPPIVTNAPTPGQIHDPYAPPVFTPNIGSNYSSFFSSLPPVNFGLGSLQPRGFADGGGVSVGGAGHGAPDWLQQQIAFNDMVRALVRRGLSTDHAMAKVSQFFAARGWEVPRQTMEGRPDIPVGQSGDPYMATPPVRTPAIGDQTLRPYDSGVSYAQNYYVPPVPTMAAATVAPDLTHWNSRGRSRGRSHGDAVSRLDSSLPISDWAGNMGTPGQGDFPPPMPISSAPDAALPSQDWAGNAGTAGQGSLTQAPIAAATPPSMLATPHPGQGAGRVMADELAFRHRDTPPTMYAPPPRPVFSSVAETVRPSMYAPPPRPVFSSVAETVRPSIVDLLESVSTTKRGAFGEDRRARRDGGRFAEGGSVDGDKRKIVMDAVLAIRGRHPDPKVALQRFVQIFGPRALEALKARAGSGTGAVKGPGGGMDDAIPAAINGQEPARLSDGEFVVPSDVVSALGDGSTDAGNQRLYEMLDRVRGAKTGSTDQPAPINHASVMPA